MDWAASEWKEGLTGLARKKVEELEEQLAKHQKMNQQKVLQNEQLEQALTNQKKKTEEEKVLNSQLSRDLQSLCEQQQELRNKNEKLHHDMQFRENQLSCLEGQLTSNKTLQANVQLSVTQIEELQMENRDLKAKCIRLEQNRTLSGSQDSSFADKIGTPARGRQGMKSEDELERFRYQNDLLSSQVKELEQKLRNLSKDRECDRHNQEATRVALETKFKEKENTYQAEIRNHSQATAQLSKQLEETKIKLQQEMSKSVALDSLRAQAEKDSTNLMAAEKEKREQQQLMQEKNNKLSELENTLAEMKKTLQQVENNQENSQLKVDAAEAKVTRLEKELKTADNDISAVRKDLERANSYEEKNKKLTEMLSTMEHNFTEKENVCKTLRNETASLQAANDQQMTLMNDLKHKNSELLQELKSKEKELTDCISNTDKLNKLVVEKDQTLVSLEEKIANSVLLSQDKDSKISQLQDSLNEKTTQASCLNQQLEVVTGNLTAVKAELVKRQEEMKRSERDAFELQKSVSLANEAREKVEVELKEEKDRLLKEKRDNVQAMEQQRKEFNEISALKKKVEDNLSSLKSAYENLEDSSSKEISSVNAKLSEKLLELSLLNKEHEQQKENISAKGRELAAKEKTVEDLEHKLCELQQSLKDVCEAKGALESDINEKDKKLKLFSETDAALKVKLSNAELKLQENLSRVEAFDAMVHERDELKNMIVKLETETRALEDQHTESRKTLESLTVSHESLQKAKQNELESLKEVFETKSAKDFEIFQSERQKISDDLRKMTESFEELDKRHQDIQSNLDEKIREIQNECSVKLQNLEHSTVAALQSICNELKCPGFTGRLDKTLLSTFNDNTSVYSHFEELALTLSPFFEKISNVEKDNENLTDSVEEYKLKLTSITKELDEANESLLSSSKSLKELENISNQKIAILDSNISERSAEVCTLNEQLCKIKDDLNSREQELSEKTKEIQKHVQSVGDLQQSLAIMCEEKDKIEQQMKMITEEQLNEKEQKEFAVGQYENKLTEAASLLNEANKNLQAFKASFRDLEDRSSSELSNMDTKLTAKTSEVSLLNEQLAQQLEISDNLKQQLNLKEESLELSEQSVSELQRSLTELLEEKEKLDIAVEQKESLLIDAASKMEDFTKIESSLRMEISELQLKLQETINKIAEYEAVKQERDELRTTNGSLLNEASLVKQENIEMNAALKSMTQRYESLEKDKIQEIESLRNEMREQATKACQDLALRLEESTANKNKLFEELTFQSASHESLKKDIQVLNHQLAELQDALETERQEFVRQKESLLEKEQKQTEELLEKNNNLLELQQKLEMFDFELETKYKEEKEKLIAEIDTLQSQIINLEQLRDREEKSHKTNVDLLNNKILEMDVEIEKLNCNSKLVEEELTQKCVHLQKMEEDLKMAENKHSEEIESCESKIKALEDELEKVYESNTDLLLDVQNKENSISVLGNNLESAEQKLVDNLNLINNIHNSVAGIHSILFPDDSFSAGSFDPDFFLMMLEKLKTEVVARLKENQNVDTPKENEGNHSSLHILDSLVVQLEGVKATLSERTAQINAAAEEGDSSTRVDPETNQLGLSPDQKGRSGELLTPDADLATCLSDYLEYIIESIKRLPSSGSTPLQEMQKIQQDLSSLKKEHDALQSSSESASSTVNELNFKIGQVSNQIMCILEIQSEENLNIDQLLEKLKCKIQIMKDEHDTEVEKIESLREVSDSLQQKLEKAASTENELKLKIDQTCDKIYKILGISGEQNLNHDQLLETLSNEFGSRKSECESKAASIRSLQETIDEVESYLQNTFEEKRKVEEELEKLQNKYSEFEESGEKLQDKILSLEQSNAEQRNQLEILEAAKRNLELGVETKTELVERLENQIQSKMNECTSLASAVQQLEESVTEKNNQLSSYSKQAEDANNKCSVLDEELTTVKVELAQRKTELVEYQNEAALKVQLIEDLEKELIEFKQIKEQNSRLQREVDDLVEAAKQFSDYESNITLYNNLKLDHEKLQLTVYNLQSENVLMQSKYSEIQAMYDQINIENQNLKSDNAVLQEELKPVKDMKVSVASLIEENDSMRAVMEGFKEKLANAENLSAKLAEMEEELNIKSEMFEKINIQLAQSTEKANELNRLVDNWNIKQQKFLEQLQVFNPNPGNDSDHLESVVEYAVSRFQEQEREISLIKEQIMEEKAQTEIVKNQYLEMCMKNSEFKTQNDFLNKELAQLKRDIEKPLQEIKTMSTEYLELEYKHADLQLKLDASESERERVKQEVNTQKIQNDEAIKKLKHDLSQSELCCKNFSNDLEVLQSQLQLSEKKNEEKCLEIEHYVLKLASVQEQLSSLEDSTNSKSREIEKLTAELGELKNKMDLIQPKLDQTRKDYESAKGKIHLLNRNARKREELMLKMQTDLEKSDNLEKSLKEEIESQRNIAKSHQEKAQELEGKMSALETKYKEKDEELATLWVQHGQLSAKIMEYESSKKFMQEQLQVVQNKPPEPRRRLKYNSLLDTPEAPTLSSKKDRRQPKTPPSPVLSSDSTRQGILTRVESSVRMTRQRTRSAELQSLETKDADTSADILKKPRLQNRPKATNLGKQEPASTPAELSKKFVPKVIPSYLQRPGVPSTISSKDVPKRPLALSYESNLYGATTDSKNMVSRRTRRNSKEGPSDCAQQ